jgi:hypothetical protein
MRIIMAETIRLSSAVKWFAQAIEKFRSENEIDLDNSDYKITYLSDHLQTVIDHDRNPKAKDGY